MAILHHSFLAFFLFVLNQAQAQTENLILNSDFEAVEYDYFSNIKRIDIPHARPQHWIGRSQSEMKVIQVKDQDLPVRGEFARQRMAYMQAQSLDSMFITGLCITSQAEAGPFSRDYVFVELSRPLEPGESYRLEAKVFFDQYGCLGLEGLGFQLYDSLPEEFDLATPLVDTKAQLLAFPKAEAYGSWLHLSQEFKAQGGENLLGLGCFLPEKDLKLYQIKGWRKLACRARKKGQRANFQLLLIGQVKLWVDKETTY